MGARNVHNKAMSAPRLTFFVITLAGAAFSQGAAPGTLFAVPQNLKPDGVPALPRELFEQIAPYTDSRTANLLDWSPARREILISTRFGNVPQVHAVAMPGGERRQMTFFADRVTAAQYNPANPDQFIFSKDSGGDEFYQLYLMDNKIGRATLLTTGGRTRNLGFRWSRTGRWISYSSTRRNGRDVDVWIMDPRSPESAKLLVEGSSDASCNAVDWSADESQILVNRRKSAVVGELEVVDVATAKQQKLGPDSGDSGYFGGQFTPDGKGAYFTTNSGGDYEGLAYIDLATRHVSTVRGVAQWDVEEMALSQDGRYLAYVVNEDGIGKLHVLGTATRQEVTLPAIPDGVVDSLHWRGGSPELGFVLSASRTPGDVYSITMGSNRLERWTHSETGGLDASQFTEPRLIHWKSFDGLTISGFLYMPPAKFSGARPVIVNIHGGPEGQSRPGYSGTRNYYLNELGIAVIYPNVRGSTGYGKAYLNADNGMKREDSVKDIGALLDWIHAQPELDAGRIMVTGGSYGGYMTLATMTHYSDRVRCALEQVGISNFVTFLEHTESYRRDLRRVEYGDERDPKMRDYFETIAPLNHASQITKPMFVVAGRNDPRVPWTEGQQITGALRKNHTPSWFLIAEDEGHGFSKKNNQDYLFAATVAFIRQYLVN
jgi:dipeptidyl aminopeptidase/acylaminoacyl peptidase